MKSFKQLMEEIREATTQQTKRQKRTGIGSQQARSGVDFENEVVRRMTQQGPSQDPDVEHYVRSAMAHFKPDESDANKISKRETVTAPYDYSDEKGNLVDIKRNKKNKEVRLNNPGLQTVANFLDRAHGNSESSKFIKQLHDQREAQRRIGNLTDEIHKEHVKKLTDHFYDSFHALRSHKDDSIRRQAREFLSSLSYVPAGKKAYVGLSRKSRNKSTTTFIDKDVFSNKEEEGLTGKAKGVMSKSDGHFRLSINLSKDQPIIAPGKRDLVNKPDDPASKRRSGRMVVQARAKAYEDPTYTTTYKD